jgi:hypothetical protein
MHTRSSPDQSRCPCSHQKGHLWQQTITTEAEIQLGARIKCCEWAMPHMLHTHGYTPSFTTVFGRYLQGMD